MYGQQPKAVVYQQPKPVVYQKPSVYQQPKVVYQQPQVAYRPAERVVYKQKDYSDDYNQPVSIYQINTSINFPGHIFENTIERK